MRRHVPPRSPADAEPEAAGDRRHAPGGDRELGDDAGRAWAARDRAGGRARDGGRLRAHRQHLVDWGVYDLRQRNAASGNAAWLSSHPGEQAPYAICWLDSFTPVESAQVRALPPADGMAGRMSDYCR